MEISSELVAVLSGIGVIQGLFLSGYLIRLRSGAKSSNALLALVLFGVSVRVGKSVLNYYLMLEPWHRNLGLTGFLLVGPALYLYGKSLLSTNWQLSRREIIHFLPSMIYLALSWLIPNRTGDQLSNASYSVVLIQLNTYIFASIFWLRRGTHSKAVYNWFRNLIIGVSSLSLYYLLIFLGWIPTYIGGAVLHSFLIYAFTYLLLRVHIFNLEKYRQSRVSNDEAEAILKEVDQLFKTEKLFLKNDLTLTEVANKLSISHRVLSQVINEQLGKNFSDYINSLRIKEAILLLKDPEMSGEPISSIAFDSGFNNATSFNQAFKKFTKITPSQFRKRNL